MSDQNVGNAAANKSNSGEGSDRGARLPFKRSDLVKVQITDTDFVLVFVSGRKVLIKDGAIRSTLEKDYKIAFAEEDVEGALLFAEAETVQGTVDALPWGALPEDFMSEADLAARETTLTVKSGAVGSLGTIGGVLGALGLAGAGGG
jgi:hypothetical protein